MNKVIEVIICKDCKGKGIRYWTEDISYHNSDYIEHSGDCKRCNNRGVLLKTTETKITTRSITDKDYKPRRSHNGKYDYDRNKS